MDEPCAVCASWPPSAREGMRDVIDRLPLREPLCEACVVAFWNNCVARAEQEEEPPRH